MNWYKKIKKIAYKENPDSPMSFDQKGNFFAERFFNPDPARKRELNLPKEDELDILQRQLNRKVDRYKNQIEEDLKDFDNQLLSSGREPTIENQIAYVYGNISDQLGLNESTPEIIKMIIKNRILDILVESGRAYEEHGTSKRPGPPMDAMLLAIQKNDSGDSSGMEALFSQFTRTQLAKAEAMLADRGLIGYVQGHGFILTVEGEAWLQSLKEMQEPDRSFPPDDDDNALLN